MPGEVVELRDRERIATHLRRDVGLHLYELGDLDDFFWPRTTWYASQGAMGDIEAIALVYRSATIPVLLAFGEGVDHEPAAALLGTLAPRLPERIYTHLSPGLGAALDARYASVPHGRHLKMVWTDRTRVVGVDTSSVVPVLPEARAEAEAFYARCYPGNWFDVRMLETGRYLGIYDGGVLVAMGGVHVYSTTQRVAALGNIATAPEQRGRGLATRIAARLCESLCGAVDTIGLNVEDDNAAAIACYTKLGFRAVARYDEALRVAR